MPNGEKSYRVGKEVYDIPESEVSSFLKDYPKALEVQSYIVDKDTFDIPVKETVAFLKDFPTAQPLKRTQQPQQPQQPQQQQQPSIPLPAVKLPGEGYGRNAGENTRVQGMPMAQQPTQNITEIQAHAQQQKEKRDLAVKNTVTRKFDKMGMSIKDNPLLFKKEFDDAKQKEVNGDLVVVNDKFGNPALTRPQGNVEALFKTFGQGIESTVTAFKVNSISDPKQLANYFEQKQREQPVVPESAPGRNSYMGELIGGAVKPIALSAIPYAGRGIATLEAQHTSEAAQRENLYFTKKNELIQSGVPEEQAKEQAAKVAIDNAWAASLPDAATMYVLSGNIAPKAKPAIQTFKQAITGTAKQAAKVGGIGASAEGAKGVIEANAGIDVKPQEVFNKMVSGFGDWAMMDLAFKALLHPTAVPKHVVAAAKEVFRKSPPEVRSQFLESAGEEAPRIEQELNDYEQAASKVEKFVPEEQVSTFAGLVEKKDNLKKKLDEELKFSDPVFHEDLQKEFDDQIKAIDQHIKKLKKSDDPIAEEIDDATGEKASEVKGAPEEISKPIELNPNDTFIDTGRTKEEAKKEEVTPIKETNKTVADTTKPLGETTIGTETIGENTENKTGVDSNTQVSRFPKPSVPINEMNSEQLNEYAKTVKDYTKNIEVEFFGEEGAKKYREAQRLSNSSFADRTKQKEADKLIDEMEASLTPEQQNEFYGIDAPEGLMYDHAEIRGLGERVSIIEQAENIDELSSSAKVAIRELDKDKPSVESRAILYAINKRAKELNISPEELIKATVKKVGNDYNDAEDAAFMVEQYLSKIAPKEATTETIEQNKLPSTTPTEKITKETTSTVPLSEKLKDVESTTKALEKIRWDEGLNDIQDASGAIYDNPKAIAEDYHKAKSDGSNPELVKAVEKLLSTQPLTKEQSKEVKDNTVQPNKEQTTNTEVQEVKSEPLTLIESKVVSEPNKTEVVSEVKTESKPFITKSGKQKVEVVKGEIKVTDAKTGGEVSRKTVKKAINEYVDATDLESGKKGEGKTDEEVIGSSENPSQLAEIYANELPEEQKLSVQEQFILDYGIGKTTTKSYDRFGDRNNRTLSKAKAYLNDKTGTPLDATALEMSEHYGIEITPEDLVDFMDRFPNGAYEAAKTFESDTAVKARDKFKQLTGIDLTHDIAEKVIDKRLEKLNKQQQDIAAQDYENRKQIEDAYWQAYAETNGFTSESNGSETKPTDTTTKPTDKVSKGDLGTKARELAAKLKSGEANILPSWMRADLPEGTKKAGLDANEVFAKALETFADIHDATKDFAKAVEEGFKHIKEYFDNNKIPYNEKELKSNFEKEVGSKEPPTGTSTSTGEGEPIDLNTKSILNRLNKSKNISEAAKKKFEEKGLKYETASQDEASNVANEVISEYGIDNAVTLAEAGKFNGDVNSFVFANALDKLYNLESKATGAEKLRYAEQWADIAIRYDEAARSKGRFISAISTFYKKSPIGVQIAEKAKRDIAFKDWFKNREKSYKEVFDEMMKEPEFEGLLKAKVEEVLKQERSATRLKRRAKIESIFDSAKITKGKTMVTIIPPPVWNGAVEVMKRLTLAGESAVAVLEAGLQHIRDNHKDKFDEEAFRKEWEPKLKNIDAKESKKTPEEITEEKKQKILDRFRKKLSGLSDKEKEEVIRRSFKQLVENGALEYGDFKKIIADILGLGELSDVEKAKMEQYIKDINAVEEFGKKLVEEYDKGGLTESQLKAKVKEYQSIQKQAEKSATGLAGVIYNKPSITERLGSIMQLKTLTLTSLIKNPFYNIFHQGFVRLPNSVLITAFDSLMWGSTTLVNKVVGNKIPIVRPDYNVFRAQAEWFKKFAQGSVEALKQVKTGTTQMDYFQKEIYAPQLRPLDAAKDLIKASKGELHLSSRQQIDKTLQVVLGPEAELVARLLNIGDKPFRYAAEGSAAAQEAARLGLKGVEKEMLLAFPKEMAYRQFKKQGLSDEKAAEKAEVVEQRIIREGEEAVFQQKNLIDEGIKAIGQTAGNIIGDENVVTHSLNSLRKIIGKALMPFQKIPLNGAWQLVNLAIPELAITQSLIYGGIGASKVRKGDASARLDFISSKKWMATAATGLAMQAFANWAFNLGAVSGGDDKDEKQKERDTKKIYTREHSVNVSLISRALTGQQEKSKTGDLMVDASWLGSVGLVLNMQANMKENMTPEERKERVKLMENLTERMTKAGYEAIDNGVFSSYMGLITAYTSGSGGYINNLLLNMSNMAVNTVQSGTFAQWSRAELPYDYKVKADDFWKTLDNNMAARSGAYRKFTKHFPPAAVTIWGDRADRNNPVFVQMLGMKRLNKDNFAQPLWDAYEKTGNLELFPSAVKPTMNGQKLNAQQALDFAGFVGQQRKILIAPFVNDHAMMEGYDQYFSKLSTEDKVDALKLIYDQGYETGKQLLIAKYPELNPEKTEEQQEQKKETSNKKEVFKKSIKPEPTW